MSRDCFWAKTVCILIIVSIFMLLDFINPMLLILGGVILYIIADDWESGVKRKRWDST
jgi:hypothetical protein